jgi:hypothetical protein
VNIKIILIFLIALHSACLKAQDFSDSALIVPSSNVLELDSLKMGIVKNTELKFLDSLARSVDPFFNKFDTVKIANPEEIASPDSISNDTLNEVLVYFTKKKIFLSENEKTIFNALIIENNTSEPVSGNIAFYLPEDWSIVGQVNGVVNLGPKQKKIIPVRFVLPSHLIGGKANVITSSFFQDEKEVIRAFSYLEIEPKIEIIGYSMVSPVYINPEQNAGSYAYKISNRGNTNELVTFDISTTIGYSIDNAQVSDLNFQFYMSPKSDTILVFNILKVSSQIGAEHAGRLRVKVNSSVKLIESSVLIIDYKSQYFDYSYKNVAPLVLSFGSLNSSMGNGTYLGGAQGKILLQNKSAFIYNVGSMNFSRFGSVPLGLGSQNGVYIYQFKYTSPKLTSGFSSRIFNRYLPVIGQGLTTSYSFKKGKLGSSIVYSTTAKAFLFDVDYDFTLRSKKIKLGALKTLANRDYDLTILRAASSVSLFKTLNFGFGGDYYFGSLTNTAFAERQQVNRVGYNLSLGTKIKKSSISGGVNFRPLVSPYYTGGTFVAQANARIRSKGLLSQNVNGQFRSASMMDLVNQNGFLFWQFSRSFGSYYLTVGPNARYVYFSRKTRDNMLQNKSSYFTGAQLSIINYLDNKQSIGFSFNPNLTQIGFNQLDSNNNAVISLSSNIYPSYNIGIRYIKARMWFLSANYINGPYFTSGQAINLTDTSFSVTENERLSLMASFYRSFVLGNILGDIRLNGNYNINPQSLNEQFSLMAQTHADLGRGFELFLNAGYYSSKFRANDQGIQSNKSINLNFRLVKSFYWQQKREQFYDLKIICFEDINANGTREESEPLIPNIRIKLASTDSTERDKQYSFAPSNYTVTDIQGAVFYSKIPSFDYDIELDAPFGLMNMSPSNGYTESVYLNEDKELFIPFLKNYKMEGKIVVIKSKYSSIGDLKPDKIVVSAQSIEGEVYRGVSDEFGYYSISIPKPGIYRISCVNKFGSAFKSMNNDVEVDFNGIKVYEYDFVFIEQERKVSFGEKTEQLNLTNREGQQSESSINEGTNKSATLDDQFRKLKTLNVNTKHIPDKTIPLSEAKSLLGNEFERNLAYTVFIGEYKGQVKLKDVDNLLTLTKGDKRYKLDPIENGFVISRDFITKDSAIEFKDSLLIQNICNPSLFGRYNELFIEVD